MSSTFIYDLSVVWGRHMKKLPAWLIWTCIGAFIIIPTISIVIKSWFKDFDAIIIVSTIQAIVLIITAYYIWLYTMETNRLATKTEEQVNQNKNIINLSKLEIEQSRTQNRLTADLLRFQKKPVVNHSLLSKLKGTDLYEIILIFNNRSNFEIYSKVCLDIFVDNIKIDYPLENERKAYQGEIYWIVEPLKPYIGHFDFGLWFLKGHKSFENYYGTGDKDFNFISATMLNQEFADKKIVFKFHHNSISSHKEYYFSAIYTYEFNLNQIGLLIPQVCDLEIRPKAFDENGKQKIEYDFTEIYQHVNT
jgi:hypothetical protein